MVRNHETSRRRDSLSVLPDARFAQGTTTKSTFKELPSDGLSRKVFNLIGYFCHLILDLDRRFSRRLSSYYYHMYWFCSYTLSLLLLLLISINLKRINNFLELLNDGA
jgi:hypothetical protein